MTPQLVHDFGVGAAVILGFLIIAFILGVVLILFRGRDDGYSPIGPALPPPPRRSPFAPGTVETGRVDSIGLGE